MTQVLQKPGFKIKQHYLTWDNGGKPFLVKINENNRENNRENRENRENI